MKNCFREHTFVIALAVPNLMIRLPEVFVKQPIMHGISNWLLIGQSTKRLLSDFACFFEITKICSYKLSSKGKLVTVKKFKNRRLEGL